MESSLNQALANLPHGPGFRFVDELTTLDPGRSASGLYAIKGSEEFLKAHFPGNPIMPGVLLIEAIAQVAGIAARSDAPDSPSFAGLRLAAVRQAKILAAVHPGDQVAIHATITARMGDLIQAEGHITIVNGENESPSTIAKARVTLSIAR